MLQAGVRIGAVVTRGVIGAAVAGAVIGVADHDTRATAC
jgi:hypothetical protein